MPRWNQPNRIVKRIFYRFEEFSINGFRFYCEVRCFPGYRDPYTGEPNEWRVTLSKLNPKLAHWQYVSQSETNQDFRHIFKTNTIKSVKYSVNGETKYVRTRT